MNSQRYFQEDTYHHLYNRGANKAKIFFDVNDYYYFLKKLKEYKEKYLIEILCYCLMTNHFHFFVRQTSEKSIGKFAGDLINSYTKTINKKYKRTGVLFEDKTKNRIVYDESSFPIVTKYILMNPVRVKLVTKFEDWEFSSANDLLNFNENSITDNTILKYFKSIDDFKSYILIEEDFEKVRKLLKSNSEKKSEDH